MGPIGRQKLVWTVEMGRAFGELKPRAANTNIALNIPVVRSLSLSKMPVIKLLEQC